MKYKESDVLSIINFSKTKNNKAEEILKEWNENKSNVPLDLGEYDYPLPVITVPIVINDKTMGRITLVRLYGLSADSSQDLMLKYFGEESYKASWDSFSHETYLNAYLTIDSDDFEIPLSDVKNFYLLESTFKDTNGKEIKYRMSINYTDNEEDYEKISQYVNDVRGPYVLYYFDNGVQIQIEDIEIAFNSLGETINERIKERQ